MSNPLMEKRSVHAALTDLFREKRDLLNTQKSVQEAENLVLQQIAILQPLASMHPQLYAPLMHLLHGQRIALHAIGASGRTQRSRIDDIQHSARKEAEWLVSQGIISPSEPTIAHPYHAADEAAGLLEEFTARAGVVAASNWSRLSGTGYSVFLSRNVKPTAGIVPRGEPGTLRMEALPSRISDVCTRFPAGTDGSLASLTLTIPFGADASGNPALTTVAYLGPLPLLDAVRTVIQKKPSLAASLLGPALGDLDDVHCAQLLEQVQNAGLRLV